MAVTILKERYTNSVAEVVLGATPEQGGTRGFTLTVGGEKALPFLHFEGKIPFPPVIAAEVADVRPEWNQALLDTIGPDVAGNPALWAKKAVTEWQADLIYLNLTGAHPDTGDKSPAECVQVVKDVLAAVSCPLIVVGCEVAEKDELIMPAIAEATAGENLLLGVAEQENYKTLTSACMAHHHTIIARSPLDINICKQLNILIREMNQNLPIVIDPTVSGLGYGIEYTYSIMERARFGALQGDKMLAMPIIATVGYEAWRAKEANASEVDFPGWGLQEERAILWEATTAVAYLQAGADILVLRHPQAISSVRKNITQLMADNSF
ncbi:MAG: acetyl-CoA decarbonylase/synthase complex subunit delta [Heliobacteriaceae bacterium]|nr:acetyl-CoA decarbonylase/synthase complex subunit delta [Heliobacteriaceae bacterium]MDD4586827.1 acetyl-CoA decarbonylase/synthase complex subunit delta [Heliobacteriaceae bacterium]